MMEKIHQGIMILLKLFGSKARVELLSSFFSNPERRFYVRELERLTGEEYKNVNRELKNLEKIGLLTSEKEGNLKYYSLNQGFVLYPELKSMIFKTAGVQGALQTALLPIKGIKFAFIYGSFATGEETPKSDVDLMVIGKVRMERVLEILRDPEEKLNREINLSLFGLSEFKEQLKKKDYFVGEVFRDPKIMLIGSEDELRKLG